MSASLTGSCVTSRLVVLTLLCPRIAAAANTRFSNQYKAPQNRCAQHAADRICDEHSPIGHQVVAHGDGGQLADGQGRAVEGEQLRFDRIAEDFGPLQLENGSIGRADAGDKGKLDNALNKALYASSSNVSETCTE